MAKVVAVYGTLRKGARANHWFMTDCNHIGTSTVKGTLYNVGAYPGFRRDGDTDVVVDLYEIPKALEEAVVRGLDGYEGYDPSHLDRSLYHRIEYETTEGTPVEIYEYAQDFSNLPTIESGDWFHHDRNSEQAGAY